MNCELLTCFNFFIFLSLLVQEQSMSDTDYLVSSSVNNYSTPVSVVRLFKRRWLMLFIYSVNSLANACMFSAPSAINDVASKYWGVKPEVIDWLPNCFLLIYIFIALPSAYFMSSFGLRVSMMLGSGLNALSACFHFAGYQSNGFAFIVIGQILAALSVGAILQIPSRLSTVWFAEHEHAKATSIGIFMNIFGVALGFLQPSQMVPDSENKDDVKNGMFQLFLSQLVFLIVCFVLVIVFFEEKPPCAPSHAVALMQEKDAKDEMSFMESLKILASDKNFNLVTHGYGLYFGMYSFFCVVLNEMVRSKVPEMAIGWMGFSCDCAGIVGVMISAVIIDKFRCYKLLSVILVFFALISWIVFTFMILHSNSEFGLFVAYCFVGFFGIPYFSIGIEQVAEMTYPVPEGTSSAIILIFGNIYGFLFILFFGAWVDKGKLPIVCYITIGVYCVAFFFTVVAKMRLQRHEAETRHAHLADTENNDNLDHLA